MQEIPFYRCCLCSAVVSQWNILEDHGCAKCGHTKITPTNLTFIEKLGQVIKHPRVWTWEDKIKGTAGALYENPMDGSRENPV